MPRLIKECIELFLMPARDDWQLYLMRHWAEIVGNLHTKMSLEKIEGSVLKVGVYDSHWIPELFMLAPTMVKTINAKLQGSPVSAIRFTIKDKKPQQFLRQQKELSVTRKTITLTKQQQTALTTIADNELRLVLEHYLIRCLQEQEL